VQENLAPRRRYDRDSVEFARVLTFNDGLYAIAMTLLIVSIAVPTISDGDSVSDLADALNDLTPNFVSFFISFVVIGRYWMAHHQFVSLLGAIDQAFIFLNLIYLAFIAFLPFPTALLGEYFENPLSVAIYATNVGIVSAMEVALLSRAYRADLLQQRLTPDIYRFGVVASLSPVVFFALSIPVAFLSTTVAVAMWFLAVPFGIAVNRRAPEGTGNLLGT
jgi:TMEM175 potassium channel family protein